MSVSCSDIAAMGGTPRFALVSLALPADSVVADIDGLYRGLAAKAAEYGVAVVGGNVSRSVERTLVDVTVLGDVPKAELVLRSGASAGDLVAVTGPLGAAAAARVLALRGGGNQQLSEEAVSRARIGEGRKLASASLARAMIDLSDGLASDLRHVCRASGVGALIRATDVPISEATRETAAILDIDPLELALAGGEDYELLVAIAAADAERARELVPGLRIVGSFETQGAGVSLARSDGRSEPLAQKGWTHF